MKQLTIATFLIISCVTAWAADFEKGLAAYNSGNYATALAEWKPLADQGNASAQANLGVMYDSGEGVIEDDREAVKWYRLAAEQGYAPAQARLGFMYANGEGVIEDDKEAFKWYRLAAQQGLAPAQYNLAVMYANGEGVIEDSKEAVKWFRLAAEQGHAEAQHNLAVKYDNGEGVIEDDKEAFKWYRLAAQQGLAPAQYNLAVMYANGEGVIEDSKEAVKWFRLAAEQGHAEAQHNLGVMYDNGYSSSKVPNSLTSVGKLYEACLELGFVPKTEKHGDCVLTLSKLESKKDSSDQATALGENQRLQRELVELRRSSQRLEQLAKEAAANRAYMQQEAEYERINEDFESLIKLFK